MLTVGWQSCETVFPAATGSPVFDRCITNEQPCPSGELRLSRLFLFLLFIAGPAEGAQCTCQRRKLTLSPSLLIVSRSPSQSSRREEKSCFCGAPLSVDNMCWRLLWSSLAGSAPLSPLLPTHAHNTTSFTMALSCFAPAIESPQTGCSSWYQKEHHSVSLLQVWRVLPPVTMPAAYRIKASLAHVWERGRVGGSLAVSLGTRTAIPARFASWREKQITSYANRIIRNESK